MVELGPEGRQLLAHVDEQPDEDGGDEDDGAAEEDAAGAQQAPAGAAAALDPAPGLARAHGAGAATRRRVPVLRPLVAAVREQLL